MSGGKERNRGQTTITRRMKAQPCAATGSGANSYINLGSQRIAAFQCATYCLFVAHMAIRVWRLD